MNEGAAAAAEEKRPGRRIGRLEAELTELSGSDDSFWRPAAAFPPS